MRLEIILSPATRIFTIPINYNYPVSSAIYRLFSESSPEFSAWLHDMGYINEAGKPFKLFTFSRLFINNPKIRNNTISGTGDCRFYFSSPVNQEHVQHLVNGLFKIGKINIGSRIAASEFFIKSVQVLPQPVFGTEMNYSMLSPASVSTIREINGSRQIYYFRPGDEGLEQAIQNNLKKKFTIIHKKEYNHEVRISLDWDYINRYGGPEKVSKLITVKEGMPDEVRLKAFVCPLRIEAEPDMQQVAYEAGIGERNSLGCGMVEAK